jgi:hypothetical protein
MKKLNAKQGTKIVQYSFANIMTFFPDELPFDIQK